MTAEPLESRTMGAIISGPGVFRNILAKGLILEQFCLPCSQQAISLVPGRSGIGATYRARPTKVSRINRHLSELNAPAHASPGQRRITAVVFWKSLARISPAAEGHSELVANKIGLT